MARYIRHKRFQGTTKVKQTKLISGHLYQEWIHQHKKINNFCTKMDFHFPLLQQTAQTGKRKNIFFPHFGCKAKLPASKWVQLQVSLVIGNSEDFNFVIDYVFCVLPWRPTTPYENDKQVRQTHSARGRMKNKWDKLTQLKAEWKTSETEEHAFSAEAIVRVLCLWNARLAIGGISRLFHTSSYILALERYWALSFKGC